MKQGESPVHPAVREVWGEVLGVDAIVPDDEFLDLGGSSLQIVEVRDLLEQRYGIRVSVAELATASSAKDLGQLVEDIGAKRFRSSHTAAVRLSGSPESPVTLFCLPGSGGSSWSFVPLAQRLPQSVSVVAIGQRGLEQRGAAHFRMSSHIRYVLRTIRSVSPHGPYYLLGHSMGAVAALGVSQQLTAAGERVEWVTMLDATLPTATAARLGTCAQSPEGNLKQERGLSIPASIRLYGQMLSAGLRRRDIAEQQRLFYEIGLRIQNRHQLDSAELPVISFTTAETAHQRSAWAQVLPAAIAIEVGGTHMDVVRPGPALDSIVAHLGSRLSEPDP